jgi:hypothetical protein
VIRRSRFRSLVAMQLDLFAEENAELLATCEAAEAAYDAAPREEAEERYGDYADLVDAAAEQLADMRDGYAATLEESDAEAYAAAFGRAAARRFPRLARSFD